MKPLCNHTHTLTHTHTPTLTHTHTWTKMGKAGKWVNVSSCHIGNTPFPSSQRLVPYALCPVHYFKELWASARQARPSTRRNTGSALQLRTHMVWALAVSSGPSGIGSLVPRLSSQRVCKLLRVMTFEPKQSSKVIACNNSRVRGG